jgi:hypothetical protein
MDTILAGLTLFLLIAAAAVVAAHTTYLCVRPPPLLPRSDRRRLFTAQGKALPGTRLSLKPRPGSTHERCCQSHRARCGRCGCIASAQRVIDFPARVAAPQSVADQERPRFVLLKRLTTAIRSEQLEEKSVPGNLPCPALMFVKSKVRKRACALGQGKAAASTRNSRRYQGVCHTRSGIVLSRAVHVFMFTLE